MLEYFRLIPPALALASAIYLVYAANRARKQGQSIERFAPTALLVAGILIGTAPRVLDVKNENVVLAASVVSLLFSMACILLVMARRKASKP
jgi:hypothetical protein